MDDLLPFNLLGSNFGNRHRHEQQPLVSGVDKLKMELQSLVSGVEKINMEHEDSIVYPSLPVVLGWIAGARSLVSGVVCNVPGFFPQLDLFVFLFASSCHHAFYHLACFLLKLKILFLQTLFC